MHQTWDFRRHIRAARGNRPAPKSRARGLTLTRAHVDRQLNTLTQQSKNGHQPVERETTEFSLTDAGKFAVRDARSFLRLARG
jgi:hypothetical protein